MRRKWNRLGKAYYRLCEYLSTKFPNAIVTDARVIEEYYRSRYGAKSHFIPYGAVTERPESREALQRLNLQSGEYFLYVSRFEPENNAHIVVQAFESVASAKHLVAVGSAPYSSDYISQLKSTRDPRILFPGAIYGTGYRELQANAFCYIHATEVGGTHPALIEAMGQGNVIIANRTPENIEVLGDAGLFYRKNDAADLARCMQAVADAPSKFASLKDAARARAIRDYSWDDVVTRYERLFQQLLHPRRHVARRRQTPTDAD
jgi:glycosyltransferase involved in cell wall biosynthesis